MFAALFSQFGKFKFEKRNQKRKFQISCFVANMELPREIQKEICNVLTDSFCWGGKPRPGWKKCGTPCARIIRELFVMLDAYKKPNANYLRSSPYMADALKLHAITPQSSRFYYLRWTLEQNSSWVRREFPIRSMANRITMTFYDIPGTKAKICLQAFVLNEQALSDGRKKKRAMRMAFGSNKRALI